MNLNDQLNRATALELAGYQPIADHADRSVFEMLSELDERVEEIGKQDAEWRETAIEMGFLISMIYVKLGFPATIHSTPLGEKEVA